MCALPTVRERSIIMARGRERVEMSQESKKLCNRPYEGDNLSCIHGSHIVPTPSPFQPLILAIIVDNSLTGKRMLNSVVLIRSFYFFLHLFHLSYNSFLYGAAIFCHNLYSATFMCSAATCRAWNKL